MKELHDKIARLRVRYQDGGLPIESRHALELVTDIYDVISEIEERLRNIEGRVDYIADKTA